VQELCHQYTVSEVAYPALPHLVEIAEHSTEVRMHALVLVGLCYAYAADPQSSSVLEAYREEWDRAARAAIPLLTGELTLPHSCESDLKYLLAALAAVHGCTALACAIEALDVCGD
jgi:hypothetical protein